MKQGKFHWAIVLTAAASLLLPVRSHAYYTNFLDTASNTLSGAYMSLTNTATNAVQRRQAAAILRALKDLSKPSTSVQGDYNLFLAAAQHLGPLVLQEPVASIGSNTFLAFTNEAQAEITQTAGRIAALSPFVHTKKAASNQLAGAQHILDTIGSLTSPQVSLLLGRQVFVKIVTANRLAAIGEAHPGFASEPPTLLGKTLVHHERGNSGHLRFDNDTQATDTDDSDGSTRIDTYTYRRTGLNTAVLTLNQPDEGNGPETTTVNLAFTSATGGRFTFKNERNDGTMRGTGTFTIE